MTVATFTQPDYTSQSASAYKAALDGAAMVFARMGDAFAPHAQSSPDMTVRLDAGAIFVLSGAVPVLTEVAAQNTGTITAPTGSNKRIDLVVVDETTGAVSVITGTPTTGTPAAPALTAGKWPVAQIGTVSAPLTVSTTSITNSMLTDIRVGTPQGKRTPADDTVDKAQLVAGYANGWVFIQKQTASSSAQIDFALPSGYDRFELHIMNAAPATDAVAAWVRVSEDSGSTFVSGAGKYDWQSNNGGSSSLEGNTSDTKIVLTGTSLSVGNATGERMSGTLTLDGARDSVQTTLDFDGFVIGADGIGRLCRSSGMCYDTADTQSVRFLFASGNIASGTFVLFGLRTDQT